MGDCHSLDPGSKFGLEKEPNGHPGPGAYTNFPIFQIQALRIYNKARQIMPVPIQTGLYDTQRLQRDSASPLVENGFSPLVENQGTNGGNYKNLLLLAATTKGSEIENHQQLRTKNLV
jgi:hypothetical protein